MSEVLDALDRAHEQKLADYRRIAEEAEAAQAGASLVGWKPLASEALAVHPSQVKEAIEDARKAGIPTEYRPTGEPVFTSREHRKRYMQHYGYIDRNAGYGDAAPGSTRRTKERRDVDLRKEYDY